MSNVRMTTRWLGAAAALAVAELWSWSDQRDTATTAFTVLRLTVILFGVYLFVVVVAGGVARALRLARATAVIDRLTLPFARTLFGSVALLGVMATPPSPTPSVRDRTVERPADPSDQGHATLHLLPDTPAPAPASPADPITDAPDPGPSDSTWVVQHGESFWSIAQSHLDDVHGRHVDEREVLTYWHALIDANRARLVTGDPDLLFTGQEIELPTVAVG